MNTWAAFAMGEANRGKELMVFDWDKAARLIKERKPECAYAGVRTVGRTVPMHRWLEGIRPSNPPVQIQHRNGGLEFPRLTTAM